MKEASCSHYDFVDSSIHNQRLGKSENKKWFSANLGYAIFCYGRERFGDRQGLRTGEALETRRLSAVEA